MKQLTLKFAIACSFMIFSAAMLMAQEYKMPLGGADRIEILEVNKVEIEGYSGSELVLVNLSGTRGKNERAEGLRAISAKGLDDNTGVGLSAIKDGSTIKIEQISSRRSGKYLLKVPKNVVVSYQHSTSWGSRLYVRNVDNELEIKTNHSSVNLTNVTGPMTVNTVHGKIEAVFSSLNQQSPVSLASVHGLVDVALPAGTKANLSMTTKWGEIFTDMDIKMQTTASSDFRKISSGDIKGTISGGGVELSLASTHNNIYLRTKK